MNYYKKLGFENQIKGVSRAVRAGFLILLLLFALSPILMAYNTDSVYAEDTLVTLSGDYQYRMLGDGTAEICGYVGAGGEITIPAWIDGKVVSRLGEFLFKNNQTITKVSIGEGIKELGKGCFKDSDNLVSVYMPDSVVKMEDIVFCSASKLKDIRLSESITSIPVGTFSWCVAIDKIELPSSLTVIDFDAFGNCLSMKEVVIPDSVTIIKDSAFYRCIELQRVRISPRTDVIAAEAFSQTESLTWITTIDWRKLKITNRWPQISVLSEEQCVYIGDGTFKNSLKNQSIVVGKNISRLGTEAFSVSTVLYGKQGSDVQSYAYSNNNVFKEYIQVKNISLNQSSANMNWNKNNTLKLSHSVYPTTASITQVGYYSSNPQVATVDGEGNVKALSEGTAVITAVSLDSANITACCDITVTTGLQDIKLSETAMVLYPGINNGRQLTATSNPMNIKDWKPKWRSSNTKIATVDQKGKVTGITPGIAYITADSENIKVSCKVIVRPAEVKGFSMNNQTTSSIKLSWKSVKGISGYALYGYNTKSKKTQVICQLKASDTAYLLKRFPGNSKLMPGTSYTLYIKPYRILEGTRYYGKSVTLKVATKPDKVKIASLQLIHKSKYKGCMIKWKNVKGASGYEVYVSTDKGRTYKRVVSIKNSRQTNYLLKHEKRRTTYYIKIRAYKNVGAKAIRGAFSKTSSIQIY